MHKKSVITETFKPRSAKIVKANHYQKPSHCYLIIDHFPNFEIAGQSMPFSSYCPSHQSFKMRMSSWFTPLGGIQTRNSLVKAFFTQQSQNCISAGGQTSEANVAIIISSNATHSTASLPHESSMTFAGSKVVRATVMGLHSYKTY